jgi:RHS repeat-associated protein
VITYSYDANGRRISKSSTTGTIPDAALTAIYDAADRMTSITITDTGQTFDLAYDENSNLSTKVERGVPGNVTTYDWDSRDRLVGITGPGLIAVFGYDGRDRRVAKIVNGQNVNFIYDGVQAVGEVTLGQLTGLLTGPGLDEMIARYSSAGARYFLTDALNSVTGQTRADRSVQNSYVYSPYGESRRIGGDEGNTIQYTARENDGIGVYYYRARYYDPIGGRFISQDPIGIGGDANLYRYVGNEPVNQIDPQGLESQPIRVIDRIGKAKDAIDLVGAIKACWDALTTPETAFDLYTDCCTSSRKAGTACLQKALPALGGVVGGLVGGTLLPGNGWQKVGWSLLIGWLGEQFGESLASKLASELYGRECKDPATR